MASKHASARKRSACNVQAQRFTNLLFNLCCDALAPGLGKVCRFTWNPKNTDPVDSFGGGWGLLEGFFCFGLHVDLQVASTHRRWGGVLQTRASLAVCPRYGARAHFLKRGPKAPPRVWSTPNVSSGTEPRVKQVRGHWIFHGPFKSCCLLVVSVETATFARLQQGDGRSPDCGSDSDNLGVGPIVPSAKSRAS